MRACEAIYGGQHADNIERLVSLATGSPCPCKQGLTCPLTDEEGFSPLALVVPKQRPTPEN